MTFAEAKMQATTRKEYFLINPLSLHANGMMT
jgi:hypothetical protein